MGLASTAVYKSRLTNSLPLVKVAEMELLDSGYYALNGECGHRLDVVTRQYEDFWMERLASQKTYRKRCAYC